MSRRLGLVAATPPLAIALLTLLAAAPASAANGPFAGNGRFDAPFSQPHKRTVKKGPRALSPAEQKLSRQEREAKPAVIPPGPLHIVVSVASQRVTVFSGGVPVAQSPVSTGMASHPTPLGIFAIIGKNKWHRSNIYSGAPMPFMQRITWSGVALHAGALPGYPASHGCIRLPEAFAIKLWAMTKLGARVIVTRDPVTPVEVAHARLFVPPKPEEKEPAAMVTREVLKNVASLAIPQNDPPAKATGDQSAAADAVMEPHPPIPPAQSGPVVAPVKRTGPVTVFVSRKDGKVYVRQEFTPLFESPITIPEPQKPWGTHVFTAMEIKNAAVRWTALTIPSGFGRKAEHDRRPVSAAELARQNKLAADLSGAPTATQALDRFELPPDAVLRISQLLVPGSALIVSDNPLSDETGLETDVVVLTP